jgi:PPK2 family polyphosphate:nucleotide phosphotransferase
MKLSKVILDELRIEPGTSANLSSRSTEHTRTDWFGQETKEKGGVARKKVAEKDLSSYVDELAKAQELLWADGTHALLIVLQAMDAAGKDGTIKHVMSGINPQGCRVESFKQPSSEELKHDFLWRSIKVLPALGSISIFNRSYYEDVLVVRVHPELLNIGDLSKDGSLAALWTKRFEDINNFEQHFHRNNTRIVKIFLHLSRDEQKKRFLKRLDDPSKRWKFSVDDLAERQHWDEYQHAYEEALTSTSTAWAPWYVVPADHKYALRALVGGIIVSEIDRLDLQPPRVAPEKLAALDEAKKRLLAEP